MDFWFVGVFQADEVHGSCGRLAKCLLRESSFEEPTGSVRCAVELASTSLRDILHGGPSNGRRSCKAASNRLGVDEAVDDWMCKGSGKLGHGGGVERVGCLTGRLAVPTTPADHLARIYA